MSEASNVESTGFKTELQKTAAQFENLMTPAEEVDEQQAEQVEEVEEAEEDIVEDEIEDDIDEDIEEAEEEVELDEQESFEEEEQPQVYSVKIDGQEQEVTLQELQQGYSRQQDYTRKTQELSQQRKDFEAQQAELAKKDAIYKELLPRMEKSLEGELANEPDWKALYESDPIAYVREKDLFNEKKEKFKAVQAEQQRLQQEQLTSQQAEIKKAVDFGNQKLLEAVPEWKDANVALKEKQSIAKYAMDVLGYSQDEINQVYDYRALLGLRDGWLHYQTRKAIKKKPVEKAPARSGKPGSANKPRSATPLKKAKQRLAKTGKLRDAAKVFENLLD
ncbi:MAG TPA: hypothetical protein DHV30_09620 [Balneola sp.]|nr:hypothetical protein [Balneola sp.]|tara:strand:+ start:495 stop:1496 length:1002 start_codon:yes stop_codon:yes gene_type:complete